MAQKLSGLSTNVSKSVLLEIKSQKQCQKIGTQKEDEIEYNNNIGNMATRRR